MKIKIWCPKVSITPSLSIHEKIIAERLLLVGSY